MIFIVTLQRVARAVIEKEANVSLRTILTIIAVASGGAEVATSDREMSVPINLVAESLIRDGVCSQLHADDPDSPCSNLAEIRPEQISSRVVTIDTGLQFGSLDTLTESLTRLELSSLQLKIYLDSIDQQIDRIEPELKIVRPSDSPSDSSENAGAIFSGTVPSETSFRRAGLSVQGERVGQNCNRSSEGLQALFLRSSASYWRLHALARCYFSLLGVWA